MLYKNEIDSFLRRKNDKKKVIVIYGPTASGKTDMSIEIAQYLDTEIISTDSRQIFRYMDIGTGKITEEEKKGVKHHMIDIITPDMSYNVGEFKKSSDTIIHSLHDIWKIPLLVGGTGLYIDSLIYDWDWGGAPSDQKIRTEIEQLSPQEVFEELKKVDSEVAAEIHPNNTRRVQRALEIYKITGKSKKDFAHEKTLKYDVLFLTPYLWDREKLYERINIRVQKMAENWLLDEIQSIFEMWYSEKDFGMQSIWYQEFFPYFRGEITLEQAIAQVQQNSRNYAKRQLTWFRNYVNK